MHLPQTRAVREPPLRLRIGGEDENKTDDRNWMPDGVCDLSGGFLAG